MNVTVEIIMPAYNCEKTIKKSIDSILNQTYTNWELYIVDDGSTDRTNDIISSYKDPRIKLIRKINGGVSSARNAALSQITGNGFIAYCDADDVWYPDHLNIAVTILCNTDYDIVYSNPRCIDEDGNQVFPSFPVYYKFDIDNLRKDNFIWISTVVHKGFLGKFDSMVDSLEDYDLWIRAAKQGKKFSQSEAITCEYLVKPNGMAAKGKGARKRLQVKHLDFITPVRLHLGCGDQYLDNYINCDLYAPKVDMCFDVATIPLKAGAVDEIMAYHIIEHFDFMESQNVLAEWYRVLKPGGVLHLETPDLLNTCKHFVDGDEEYRIKLYGHFFAWPWLPGQAHKFLFTEVQLRWTLEQIGFKNIQRLPPDSIYARSGVSPELFLNLIAYK